MQLFESDGKVDVRRDGGTIEMKGSDLVDLAERRETKSAT